MFTDATNIQSSFNFIITPVGFIEWFIHFPNHGVMCCLLHMVSTLVDNGIGFIAIAPLP